MKNRTIVRVKCFWKLQLDKAFSWIKDILIYPCLKRNWAGEQEKAKIKNYQNPHLPTRLLYTLRNWVRTPNSTPFIFCSCDLKKPVSWCLYWNIIKITLHSLGSLDMCQTSSPAPKKSFFHWKDEISSKKKGLNGFYHISIRVLLPINYCTAILTYG